MVFAVALSSQAQTATIATRDHRLHQRGGERERDAAPHGLLVGDQIG